MTDASNDHPTTVRAYLQANVTRNGQPLQAAEMDALMAGHAQIVRDGSGGFVWVEDGEELSR